MTKIRINKYLSECGIASRRKSEEIIEQGRVEINGTIILDLATMINPEEDEVAVDGETIKKESKIYILLNKPKGYITTTSDEKNRLTVLDLINIKEQIFPVGRLDFNTTGMLLLTNDGDFANLLTHPSNNVPRVYLVTLDNPLKIEDRQQLEKGIILDKRKSRFEEIAFPDKGNFRKIAVTTTEGRNHFVKRMFASMGYFVKKLHRHSYAGITDDKLKPGEYKLLPYKFISETISRYAKHNH